MKHLAALVATTIPLLAFAADPQPVTPPPNSPASPIAQTDETASTPPPANPPQPPPAELAKEAQPTVVESGETKTSEIIHTPEDAARLTGFQFGGDLDHWLGTGTFVNPDLYSSLSLALTLYPAYSFKLAGINLRATMLGRLIYEYTLPNNDTGRRVTPWDLRLGLTAPIIWREKFSGIALSPSIGVVVPTSPESWQAGMIANVTGGLALTRSLGPFDLSLSGSLWHGFYTGTQDNVRRPSADTLGTQMILCRTGESICNSPGMNTEWTAIGGASVNFHATKELIFSLSYSYFRMWKYALPVDQYSPPTLDSNGNQVAKGVGGSDFTFGLIAVGYDISEHYNVSVSASTIQTPKTMGGSGQAGSFRFPFWSFGNAADNTTSVNFTLSAMY